MFRAYGSFPSNGDDHGDVTTTKTSSENTTDGIAETTQAAISNTTPNTLQTNNKQIDLFDIILNQNTTNTTTNLWNGSGNNAAISCSLINDFNNLLVSTSQISSHYHHQEQQQQYNQQSLDNLYGMGVVTKTPTTAITSTTTTAAALTSPGIITNGSSTNGINCNNKNHNRYNFTGNFMFKNK